MKKIFLLFFLLLASCSSANKTTKAVSNFIIGPNAMPQLPELPNIESTGMIAGRRVENIMVDITTPEGTDYGNEDNPLTGMKEKFYELFNDMGYSVYITNGTFVNDPERIFDVIASETAVREKTENSGTVPDAILKVDWREERWRNPITRIGSLIIPGRAELQMRAVLWGPDGRLVWKDEITVPIKRSSFITGGSISNQFRQPARKAGARGATEIFEKVKGFFIFSGR